MDLVKYLVETAIPKQLENTNSTLIDQLNIQCPEKSGNKETVVMVAAKSGRIEIVKYLHKMGADLLKVFNYGNFVVKNNFRSI